MFYPAHLNLDQQPCLVIGSGSYAERRVVALYRCGATVTWIGPESTPLLDMLTQSNQIKSYNRKVVFEDLAESYLLVFIETGNKLMNSELFHRSSHIPLVNVHDVVHESTFASTSLVTTDELTVSVSTGGHSPALCRYIRQYIELIIGKDAINHPREADINSRLTRIQVTNGKFPLYPVGLMLEGRTCLISQKIDKKRDYQKRFDLLKKCGAIITNQPTKNTFLAFTHQSYTAYYKLSEVLDQSNSSRFVTPKLIMNGDLIIGISPSSHISEDSERIQQIYDHLREQFTKNSYGKLLGLLGSLRPTVSKNLPLAEQRQHFYSSLILRSSWGKNPTQDNLKLIRDQITLDQDCCLAFGNPDCQIDCLLNAIRLQHYDSAQLKTKISNQVSISNIKNLDHHMLINTNLTHLSCQPDCLTDDFALQESSLTEYQTNARAQQKYCTSDLDHHMLINSNSTRLLYDEETSSTI